MAGVTERGGMMAAAHHPHHPRRRRPRRGRAPSTRRWGWTASSASQPEVAFFQGNGLALALFGRAASPRTRASRTGRPGFCGHLARLQRALEGGGRRGLSPRRSRAGAHAVKPPHDVFWGGYSGYFADPDGHLWEVAWNPFFPIDEHGNLFLPDSVDVSAPIDLPAGPTRSSCPRSRSSAAFLVAGPRRARHRREPADRDAAACSRAASARARASASRCSTRRTSSSPGLPVAVAYHAGLFNIGGEGQATLGGPRASRSCSTI